MTNVTIPNDLLIKIIKIINYCAENGKELSDIVDLYYELDGTDTCMDGLPAETLGLADDAKSLLPELLKLL